MNTVLKITTKNKSPEFISGDLFFYEHIKISFKYAIDNYSYLTYNYVKDDSVENFNGD